MRLLILLALLQGHLLSAGADTVMVRPHPKQGIAELLLEYLEVHYNSSEFYSGDLLYVSVRNQSMFHVRDGVLLKEYPISTARNGLGSERDSYRTPTGLHRISEKFGDGVPPYGVLRDRVFTGEIADTREEDDADRITSRVLWLEGLEPGHNRGGTQDSHARCIYIHGTSNEAAIGRPVSRGCIRMRNQDVLELYDRVPVGTLLVVLDN